MKTTGALLAEWAIQRIEKDYRDDVCLLLEHTTLDLECDRDSTCFGFFVPATHRANALARDFIIGDIGHDLFPMDWARLEKMADMKDYNSTCLCDAVILYARSQDDRRRFEALRSRQQANLSNPAYMRDRARDWLNTAMETFSEMMLEDTEYRARMCAAYICDTLALSVALYNGCFFKHGQTGQLKVLASMERVPEGFEALYKGVVHSKTVAEMQRLCREMIRSVKALLRAPEDSPKPDYETLKLWYQEMCYTWRRVYHFIDAGDPINAFIWCCYLQNEVDEVGRRNGIAELDLYSAFNADDLTSFRRRLEASERAFVRAITEHGLTLERYADIHAFLSQNPA